MNTIYIVIIISLIISIVKNYKKHYLHLEDWIRIFFVAIFLGFFLGFLIALVIPSEKELVLSEQYELKTFKDNKSLNGDFFLERIITNKSVNYKLYYKENNSFKLIYLDYKDVILKYSDENPRMEVYTYYGTNSIINNYSFSIESHKYIIYIPKGTIKE